ncbi:hypothetical protein BC832DRAFT_452147 [Gaertneriomyces semiglobifer]|nr:hypothetical protein BC832DRAFT_452147 [Gaertneriomyces semiglobifer]
MMDARREEAMRPMPLKGNAEEGDGLMTPGLGLGIQPPRTVRTTVTAISPGRLTTTSNGLQFILQTAGVCGKGCKQEDILSSSGIVSLSVASSRSDCPSCFDATTTVSFPPISRPLVKPNAMFGIVDKIDFQGQGVAELIIHLFLTAGAAIGFLLGLVLQSVSITFYILGASLLLTAIC